MQWSVGWIKNCACFLHESHQHPSCYESQWTDISLLGKGGCILKNPCRRPEAYLCQYLLELKSLCWESDIFPILVFPCDPWSGNQLMSLISEGSGKGFHLHKSAFSHSFLFAHPTLLTPDIGSEDQENS